MSTDKPRYSITVDDETFAFIEDYRFANRFQSRSEATVDLIKRGIEAVKAQSGIEYTTLAANADNAKEMLDMDARLRDALNAAYKKRGV